MGKRNLYLVGFMGTGKSTIGRELARVLGRKFIDIDNEIEKRHKASVAEIFQKYGEVWFRQREQEICEEISVLNNRVVATGGGTLLNETNFQLFRQSGLLLCLYTQRDCLIERLERSNRRPLLHNTDIPEKVDSLLAKRRSLYERIHIRIDTTEYTPLETARRIAELIHNRQNSLEKLNESTQFIDLS